MSSEAPTDANDRPLSPDEFRNVIGHFASGVTIVTTQREGVPHGTTASAVSSLSLQPPMMLACLNTSSTTGQSVAQTGRFAVNILAEHQHAMAAHFATKDPGKFTGVDFHLGPDGQPLLAEALAHLECRVVEQAAGGTHVIFIAEVTHAAARSGVPLAYFRGQFGRFDPLG